MNHKDLRFFMGRGTMLGDVLAAIPTATYIKKYYENPYITWAMGKKSGSAAMLYLNHPDLDSIYVCEGSESPETETDIKKMNSHDVIFNLNPPHPDNEYPRSRDIYFESFLMAGFTKAQWALLSEEEQCPKLIKWWNPVKKPFEDKKTIFFTGRPNFGKETKRAVSQKYLDALLIKLISLGYNVVQSGGEDDPIWFKDSNTRFDFSRQYKRINELSFFDQIKIANECDLIVGSDSGMSLICGAYRLPMISLIPIHWGNEENPSALSTNNPNNYSFYSFGGTDNISFDAVVSKIEEKLNLT